MTRNVAILLFDDVEVLDFAGPFEIFAVTNEVTKPGAFAVHTVAATLEPVTARNGLVVVPSDSFESVPPPEVLVLPGGFGTRRAAVDPDVLTFVREASESAEIVLSVCTGARLLAALGWLSGLTATTHHSAIDELRERAPDATWVTDRRFVDNGRIITAAGVAAGIDASLHVVARLLGDEVARRSAAYVEYPWSPA